jgi:hypothetical protein
VTSHRAAPWKHPDPKKKSGTKLTPANVKWAKARAKKAGRRYPNLVDNMAAVRKQNKGSAKKQTRAHP